MTNAPEVHTFMHHERIPRDQQTGASEKPGSQTAIHPVCRIEPLRATCFSAIFVLLATSGCLEGPLGGGGRLNPYIRREWEQDEAYGPTFHSKIERYISIRKNAASMSPEAQAKFAEEVDRELPTESNGLLRSAMISAVGQMAGEVSEDILSAACQDPDVEVRMAACRALGKRKTESSVESLAKVAGAESDPDVRIEALRSLGAFKDNEVAREALKVALEDRDVGARFVAIQSLEKTTGRYFGADVGKWREYLDGQEIPDSSRPSVVAQARKWIWWW